MTKKTCPQCKVLMQKMQYEIGYGIDVESYHCQECGFNVTEDKHLQPALKALRLKLQKEIKLVQVGNGIGVRIPNELAKSYKLKKGEAITLKPEDDGIKLVTAV